MKKLTKKVVMSLVVGTTMMTLSYGCSSVYADGKEALKWGSSILVDGNYAVGIGQEINAKGEDSIAFGYKNKALNFGSKAIGSRNRVSGMYALGYGDGLEIEGNYAVVIGNWIDQTKTMKIGSDSITVGNDNYLDSLDSIAVGNANETNCKEFAIMIGNKNKVYDIESIAIGLENEVQGQNSIAIGSKNKVHKNNSIALGNGVQINGDNSVAIGNNALAVGEYSVALGSSAYAGAVHTHINAQQVTFGPNTYKYAFANVKGAVSLGDGDIKRQIHNMGSGVVEEYSTDGINGSQLYATNKQVEANRKMIEDNIKNFATKTEVDVQKQRMDKTFPTLATKTEVENLRDSVHDEGQAEVENKEAKQTTPQEIKLRFKASDNSENKEENEIIKSSNAAVDSNLVAKNNLPKVQDKIIIATNPNFPLTTINTFAEIKIKAPDTPNNVNVQQTSTPSSPELSNKPKELIPSTNYYTTNIENNRNNIKKNNDEIKKNTADIEKNTMDIGKNTRTVQRHESKIERNREDIAHNADDIAMLQQSDRELDSKIDSVGALSAALAGLHPLPYKKGEEKGEVAAAMGNYCGKQALALGGFWHANRDLMFSMGMAAGLNGTRRFASNVGVTLRFKG